MAIDLPHIHAQCKALTYRVHRAGQIERDVEVFGEMIERAERQDSQGHLGPHQGRGDGVEGAIAAPSDHRLTARLYRPLRQCLDLTPTTRERETGDDPLLLEEVPQTLAQIVGDRSRDASARIEDDRHRPHHRLNPFRDSVLHWMNTEKT